MKNKEISLLIFITFIGYIFLANFYFLERVVMPDTSFQLFQILRNEDFAIQINRFGAVMTQIFPLIACKLGLSFESVLRIYSMSFPICYIILVSIILFYYQNLRLGIVFFSFHFLINTHSFFWCQCELIQAVSLFLVWIAFLEFYFEKNKFGIIFWFLNLGFIISLIFFYPLIIILVVFAFLFLFKDKLVEKNTVIWITLGLYLFITILKNIFFRNYYDSGSMSSLRNFIDKFPNYFIQLGFKNFWNYLIHDYYLLCICYFIVLYHYVKEKNWYKLILFNVFFLGIIIIINVCFSNGADQFYLEGQYSLVCIVIGFYFAYDFKKYEESRYLYLIGLLIVFCLFLNRVFSESKLYSDRISVYSELCSQYKSKKVLIKETEYLKNKLKMTWGSSYEVWLMSTLNHGKSNSLLIHSNPSQYLENQSRNKALFTSFEKVDYSDLKSKYFKFSDSTYYIIE